MQDYVKLVKNLGFNEDPFATTNADEEMSIESYFVKPQFFDAVYGDFNRPKSSIVFAPRGGGKTALKRMIELDSQNKTFLCVTYNNFDTAGLKLSDINYEYHLRNLVRLVLVALISGIKNKKISEVYSSDERHYFYMFIYNYLNNIESTMLKDAIKAVKNNNDKAMEWWNKFSGPIGLVLNNLFAQIGFEKIEVEKFSSANGKLGSLEDQLRVLYELAFKAGYSSIYVLVDKVDENSLTGDAIKSFDFIEPLISSLQFLEMKGYGYKFFLWDLLQDKYQKAARPDRVKYHNISWDNTQMIEMLSQRVQAFSDKKIMNFSQIVEGTGISSYNFDEIISLFSNGSPRLMIRLCKEIIDRQSLINCNVSKISISAVLTGIDNFAKNYSEEIIDPNILRELKKVKKATFTIKYIYNEVFKFTQQAGLSKINSWQQKGLIELIGTVQETKGAKNSNIYAINDPIVARHILKEFNLEDFLNKKIVKCAECGAYILRDWDSMSSSICSKCDFEIILA